MPRVKDPRIEQRNETIINEFNQGATALKLAKNHGLSLVSVKKIVQRSGFIDPNRPRAKRKKLFERKALTALHRQIGAKITHHRTLKADMTVEQLAWKLNFNREKLREIEHGVYDLTLMDLVSISKELDVSIASLVTERTQ